MLFTGLQEKGEGEREKEEKKVSEENLFPHFSFCPLSIFIQSKQTTTFTSPSVSVHLAVSFLCVPADLSERRMRERRERGEMVKEEKEKKGNKKKRGKRRTKLSEFS